MKSYIKLFEEFKPLGPEEELELSTMGFGDDAQIKRLAEEVSAQILSDYAEVFDQVPTDVADPAYYTPEAILAYFKDLLEANPEMTVDDLYADFGAGGWRSYTYELGLGNL